MTTRDDKVNTAIEALPEIQLDLENAGLPGSDDLNRTVSRPFEVVRTERVRVLNRTLRIPSPAPADALTKASAPSPAQVPDFSKTMPLAAWQGAKPRTAPVPSGEGVATAQSVAPEMGTSTREDLQKTVLKPLKPLLPVGGMPPQAEPLANQLHNAANLASDLRQQAAHQLVTTTPNTTAIPSQAPVARDIPAWKRALNQMTWPARIKYLLISMLFVLGGLMLIPERPAESEASPSSEKAGQSAPKPKPSSSGTSQTKPGPPNTGVAVLKATPTEAGNAKDQRAAIDALANGDLARAIELYEKLARENPDSQAYRAAARILREKGEQR